MTKSEPVNRPLPTDSLFTGYDEIGRASIVLPIKVFSRFLAMSEVGFWCIHAKGKQTREMDTALSKRDRS